MSGSAPRRYPEFFGGRNRRPRRGDKRRLTREDDKTELRSKQDELARHLERRNEIKNQQRNQKNQKTQLYDKKEEIHVQLTKLQKEIGIRTEEMNRSKASVLYRTVERHDEAIRRIESQLRYNNFKLSEEKRLVTEIDSLKKSKRDLAKFRQVQSAVDELKAKQNALRDERKSIFNAIGESKKKEDSLKDQLKHLSLEIEQVKAAIEELQTRVQSTLTQSSSGDECQPTEVDSEGQTVSADASNDSASLEVGAISRKLPECKIDIEDFKDESDTETNDSLRQLEGRKLLCRNLIFYLRALLPDWAFTPDFPRPQPPTKLSLQLNSQSSSPPSTPLEGATASSDSSSATVSKISSVSDPATLMSPSASSAAVSVLMGTHNRLPDEQIMRRRPAGYKLQRSARVLNHKPDVFHQFGLLNMQPPSGVAELPDCIQRLSTFLEELETAPPVVSLTSPTSETGDAEDSMSNSERPTVAFERSLSNPSNGESGFSETSTTPLRPRSPELSRCLENSEESLTKTSVTHDDLLSTSSTICSEDNCQSSSTDISPLTASLSST